MAITASITLTSAAGDLVTDALVLSTSANLTKAGTSTALAQTSGLARKTTGNTTEYTLFDASVYTDDAAHKVYLKNISTTSSEYFEVQIAEVVVGKLYAGDWALFPWSADTTGTNCNITITPQAADMTLEYMLFYE